MYFIYDNLTATLVGGTVILMMLAMQTRIMKVNVQQTITYMTKKHSLNFADWLQRDLLKIGYDLHPDDPDCDDNPDAWGCRVIENPQRGDGGTTRFIFYRDSLREENNVMVRYHMKVKYELEEVDPGGSKDLFRAIRWEKMWEDGTAAPSRWTRTGSSPGLLRHFEIEMLDENGDVVYAPADNMDDVKQTSVKFSLEPPLETAGDLRAMHWGSSLLLRY